MVNHNKNFPSFLQATVFAAVIIPALQIIIAVLVKTINICPNDSINRTLAYSISMILALLILYRLAMWKNKTCQFSFKIVNWKLIPITFILALLLTILEFIAIITFVNLLPSLPQERGGPVDLAYLVKGVIIASILEELIFRGIILENFLKRYSYKIAIFMSAFLFGISHLNLLYLPIITISFYVVGWMYSHTRSLVHCIFYHATANAISLGTVYYLTNSKDSIPASYSGEISSSEAFYLLIAFVISATLLMLCIRYMNKLFSGIKNNVAPLDS